MKYALTINLEALFKLVTNYTYNEAAILDYLFFLCSSPSDRILRINIGEIEYTWVDSASLLANLPFLSFNNGASVSRTIKRLEKDKFISIYNGKNYKMYIHLMPKIMKLYEGNNKLKLKV